MNVVGGLLIGVLAQVFLAKADTSQEFRLFLTTGLLGGFTTFSAFSLDAARMWQRSDYAPLVAYILASVALSIGAVFLGMAGARAID